MLEDLNGLEIVFGGNPSVLIDSVTTGVPSAYVDDLDHGSPDLHRFVAAGLIYQSDVNPNLDAIWRFYEQPEWNQTLKTFANIDQDQSAVLAEAVKIITELQSTHAPFPGPGHLAATRGFRVFSSF